MRPQPDSLFSPRAASRLEKLCKDASYIDHLERVRGLYEKKGASSTK